MRWRRAVGLLGAATAISAVLMIPQARAAECLPDIAPPESGEARVWFQNEREYVLPSPPVEYGAALPLRTIVTADVWVQLPDGAPANVFAYRINLHAARQDIVEWSTQTLEAAPLHPGKPTRLTVWQQRTQPGVNVLDIHANLVGERGRDAADYRLCWIGVS